MGWGSALPPPTPRRPDAPLPQKEHGITQSDRKWHHNPRGTKAVGTHSTRMLSCLFLNPLLIEGSQNRRGGEASVKLFSAIFFKKKEKKNVWKWKWLHPLICTSKICSLEMQHTSSCPRNPGSATFLHYVVKDVFWWSPFSSIVPSPPIICQQRGENPPPPPRSSAWFYFWERGCWWFYIPKLRRCPLIDTFPEGYLFAVPSWDSLLPPPSE